MTQVSRRFFLTGASALALTTGLGLPATAAPPVLPTLVPLPEAEAPLWEGYGRKALIELFVSATVGKTATELNPVHISFIAVSAVELEDWRQILMSCDLQQDLALLDWLEREGTIRTLAWEPARQGFFPVVATA